MLVMPVSSRCRPCEFISTTNRKCHKLFAVFLVNIWIVQSCYFVHCLHLPRCLYYTQCHHSMSSFSPLPYLHYLLHHLHRCINFLLIFPTVLAYLHVLNLHHCLLFLFFCLPSPLLHTHGCCPNSHNRFYYYRYYTRRHLMLLSSSILHFTHIHQFLLFLFFCLPSPLLHHCLHTHGCCSNIHHCFYYTRSHLLLLFSSISLFYSY